MKDIENLGGRVGDMLVRNLEEDNPLRVLYPPSPQGLKANPRSSLAQWREELYNGPSGKYNRTLANIKEKQGKDAALEYVDEVENMRLADPDNYGHIQLDFTLLSELPGGQGEPPMRPDEYDSSGTPQAWKDLMAEPWMQERMRTRTPDPGPGASPSALVAPDAPTSPFGPPQGLSPGQGEPEGPMVPPDQIEGMEATTPAPAPDPEVAEFTPVPGVTPYGPPAAVGFTSEYKRSIQNYVNKKSDALLAVRKEIDEGSWEAYSTTPIGSGGGLVITDDYGSDRGQGEHHTGLDLRARAVGTPIYAPFPLYIINEEVDDERIHVRGGKYIAFRNAYDGSEHKFMHIDGSAGREVDEGTVVPVGSLIAYTGGSGVTKSGSPVDPHLHWEATKDGKLVDPKGYIPKGSPITYKSALTAPAPVGAPPGVRPGLAAAEPAPPGGAPVPTPTWAPRTGAAPATPEQSAHDLSVRTSSLTGAPEHVFRGADERVARHEDATRRELALRGQLQEELRPDLMRARTAHELQKLESAKMQRDAHASAIGNIKTAVDKAQVDVDTEQGKIRDSLKELQRRSANPWQVFSFYKTVPIKNAEGKVTGTREEFSPAKTAMIVASAIGLVGNAFESYKTRKKRRQVPFVALDLIKTAIDVDMAAMSQSSAALGETVTGRIALIDRISDETTKYANVQATLAKEYFSLAAAEVAKKAAGSEFGALIIQRAKANKTLLIERAKKEGKTVGELIKAEIADADPKNAKDAYSLLKILVEMEGAQKVREISGKALQESEAGVRQQVAAAKAVEQSALDARKEGFLGTNRLMAGGGSGKKKGATKSERDAMNSARGLIRDLLDYKKRWKRWQGESAMKSWVVKQMVANQNKMPFLGAGSDKDANIFDGWMLNLDWQAGFGIFGEEGKKLGQMINDFAWMNYQRLTLGATLKRISEPGNLNLQEAEEGRAYLPQEQHYHIGLRMIDKQINRLMASASGVYYMSSPETQGLIRNLLSEDAKTDATGDYMAKHFGISDREKFLEEIEKSPALNKGRAYPKDGAWKLPEGSKKIE